MKTVLLSVLVLAVVGGAIGFYFYRATMAGGVQSANAGAPDSGNGPRSFYELSSHTLMGEPIELAEFAGRVALVVNVASKCGLTPQYAGLEKLHDELKDRGFTVLGFPSNDFMNQEPGSPEQILEFCSSTYGVSFPMFEKVVVKGEGKTPVFEYLTRELEEPTWNFTKYLVDRSGRVLYRFAPKTAPDDPEMRAKIEAALAASAG
jgi:glutathione peroxidase